MGIYTNFSISEILNYNEMENEIKSIKKNYTYGHYDFFKLNKVHYLGHFSSDKHECYCSGKKEFKEIKNKLKLKKVYYFNFHH